MRKATQLMMTLLLLMAGVVSASAKSYTADLDPSMFKAWDGYLPGANVVAEPEAIDDGNAKFECTYNLYKEIGAGGMVYGNTNVYYLWYADITGTKTLTIEGTKGMQLRVLINRPEPEEGGTDAHGGTTTEIQVTLDDNGKAVVDLSGYEYVHLNAIKAGWGSPAGTIRKLELVGAVKPLTGILSMIDNGDAEGDDLNSFPVSYDGPNNNDTANDLPEIVAGEGVDGSKCFKVVSFPDPTETWHTQFYIKSDEVLPKGTKWALKMSVKADHDTKITTSAQAKPRAYKGGFISEFAVGTEWKEYTWNGVIDVDDFQSIAFDLNNGDERNENGGWLPGNGSCGFYFDNIEFGVDLGAATPAALVKAAFSQDVVRVDFGNPTNMKDLVAAAGGERVVFPNDCVKLSVNGQPSTLMSVEGRPDGYLYIFIDENYAEGEDDVVSVSFTNPADKALHLTFTDGKFAGEDCPDFVDVIATLEEGLEENYSYLLDNPAIVTAEPENGSFNLDGTLKEFKFTFDHPVKCDALTAKLNKENLTVAPATGFSYDITLTRTGSNELKGEYTLTLSNVQGERILDVPAEYELTYSFGPLVIDPNDQPKDLIDPALFADCEANGIPTGFLVNFNGEEREGGTTGLGGGPRMFNFSPEGEFAKGLYFREGYVEYGSSEGYALQLEAGKHYNFTFNAAQWKDNGTEMIFTIASEDDPETPVYSENLVPACNVNGDNSGNFKVNGSFAAKYTFVPEETGNYVIRWNSNGYHEDLLANPQVKYVPSVLGAEETQNLAAALENAKTTLANNSDARYAGEAYNALDAVIKQYEGKTMTAPSAFNKAVEELNAAVKAMTDHRTLCDDYDALPEQAFNLYSDFKGTKFSATELYTSLKTAVNKYCKINVEGEGEEAIEVLESFTLFYQDAELEAAKKELSDVIEMTKKMFTEGKSHNLYGGGDRTTGYAALHERLRRGVELLKSLGADENDLEIKLANAELGDNDQIAEAIMTRASRMILGDLASNDPQIFIPGEEDVDVPTYDLSVYMKNPNIYSPANSTEVPGWTSVRGNATVFPGWGAEHGTSTPYAEDCQLHAGWHPGNLPMVEQTIENLPAGIYTIKIDGSDNNSEVSEGTYGYVKTSSTPAFEEVEEFDPDQHFAGYVQCSGDIEGIEVVDGKLTVGFSYGAESQAFINEVTILLTAPVAGYDYSKAFADGIETLDNQTAKVRAIELFDLNGRRITSVRSGVAIVKKHMSDGTVRTEKVLKK